ncbi:MAG: cadherin repeat domain-containing protein, partial [Sulfurimonas sp.]|nr:cadherin repeat domain-containing protein [Sulfurimonas sp.]
NAIDENVTDGTYTGVTLNATDADGDAIAYSVADDVPFSVDADGRVVTDGAIDFEENENFTFDVTATSADGTSSSLSVSIDVNDIVESVVGETINIDGGEGLDTLVFNDDMNIDLSALDDNISNIEVLDLATGTQNISLTVDDVLNVTDDDNILRIDGDSTDTISLGDEGEWTLGDFKTDAETGASYQEVTGQADGQDITLEISTDITIDQS